MDHKEQPSIVVERIFIADLVFALKENVAFKIEQLNGEYDLTFEFGFDFQDAEKASSKLRVTCTNKNNPELVKISVVVMGIFKGPHEKLEYFIKNSGSSLFPYARSIIHLVTAQGPMNPLMLPIMNLTEAGLVSLKELSKKS